jgi:hypothetical protein
MVRRAESNATRRRTASERHRRRRCTFRQASALVAAAAFVVVAPRVAHADPAEEIAHDQEAYVRDHGDRPIAAIRIEGLHRTKPAVVQQWVTCHVGAPLSSCDLVPIRERIYRLAIFRRTDVKLVDRPDGVEIVFAIEEKWSLYPVPMLWYTPGTEFAGLVIAEANILGYNKGLAVGGLISNRGWYTIAGYSDPNIAFTDGFFTIHAFFGSGLVEDDLPDGTIEQSFDMKRFDAEYVIGWTFLDRLSPALSGGVRGANIGTVHVPGVEPATNASVLLQGVALNYSDRRFRDLYDEGLRASAEAQHAFPLDHTTASYNVAIFDARYARRAFRGGYWEAHGRTFLGALPIAFEERLGGLDGSRTIPGSGLVAADKYAYLSLETQVPLVRLSLGTMSAGAFGEIGRYVRNAEPAVTYGGPGVGVRFFVRDVAIPAFGVDVGYEVGSRRFSFSVAIGYRPVR